MDRLEQIINKTGRAGVSREQSRISKITNPSGIKDEAAHIILEGAWKYFVLEEVRELGKHVLSFWVKGKLPAAWQ